MKSIGNVGLANVQAVYSGPEGDLWELIMGEQIHLGGFQSSMDLAKRAGIAAGQHGIDLCCCNGAGMRFLVRFLGVASMTGVDATPAMIERGLLRCAAAGMIQKTNFTLANVCDTGLPAACADFVWGEDAWCYVVDKPQLIREAARLVKPGGLIAFTDWIEGPVAMTGAEAERFLAFMKFPNIEDLNGYRALLDAAGCPVLLAEDTGRFGPCIDLYLDMLNKQLTYDALRIIGFDLALMKAMGEEMVFVQGLVHAKKLIQGIFIARKTA